MATSQTTPPRQESPLSKWWDMYKQAQESATDHRVRVFVRSMTPTVGEHNARQHRFEALETAVDGEAIETYDVTVLGDEICFCESCTSQNIDEERSEIVDRLRHWEHEGLEASGFVVRTVSSSVTGETYSTVVPPEVSFGIYLDADLVGVFPCTDGEQTYSPETYLERLGFYRDSSRL